MLTGGVGDDVVRGDNGDDTVYGGDDICSAAMATICSGGEGDDLLEGGAGNDTLVGGAGDDVLYGDGRRLCSSSRAAATW